MLKSILKDLVAGHRPATPAPTPGPAPAPGASGVPRLAYRRGGTVMAFVPSSRGDALRQHTIEMASPLRPHCDEIVVLDFNDPSWKTHFDAAAARPVWFAMSPFGGGEIFSGPDGSPYSPWLEGGIPFVRLFGDVPAYFPLRHLQHLPNSVNAYGHVEHMEFFLRWFAPKAAVLHQPLFPLDRCPREAVDAARKAASALVVFPKNGNCPDRLRGYWRERLAPALAGALEAVAEEALARLDAPLDFADALRTHFAQLSIDLRGNRELVFFLVAQLDDYLRRVKSTMIARALLDLPVTIRGGNWEHLDFRGRRARHDPDADYTATRAVLDQATAIVDMSPNTHRGAHDRVLRAAGRHTAFLTNRTAFYETHFDDVDRFAFRFAPQAIADCVTRALDDRQGTVDMGLRQAVRMRELLTEDHYVRQLVAAVDACAAACGPRPEGTQDFVDFSALPATGAG